MSRRWLFRRFVRFNAVKTDYIKVVKFGGSSLADAAQFKKVIQIIRDDESRRYVVPSAPGKRFSGDFKVTDKLYECYNAVVTEKNWMNVLNVIKERYAEIVDGLGIDFDLETPFDEIAKHIESGAGSDYIASRGEYLNALILAAALGYDFIDAADVLFFEDSGMLDAYKTQKVMSTVLKLHPRAVIPGFYGSLSDGTIKTFSRGGSDVSGSVVARACNADLYENWTDVSGFLVADPRIVDSPKTIDVITYHELRELSYMGANVLHEDSIFPVRMAGIPINIRNTNKPSDKGTMIIAHADSSVSANIITGIAGKGGFSVLTIEKDMMNSQVGFGKKVLQVFEKYSISFEHLPSGIDSMGVIVSTAALDRKRDVIINEICRSVEPDSIQLEEGLALVAVVGRGMVNACGTAARIFSAIAEVGVNVRMIDQGSSEYNIIVSVAEKDMNKTIRAIYEEFSRDLS